MESTEGESSRGAGQSWSALLELLKTIKKAIAAGRDQGTEHASPEPVAISFRMAVFKAVEILLLALMGSGIACGLGHLGSHDQMGEHKTVQVQATLRRAEGGRKYEVQKSGKGKADDPQSLAEQIEALDHKLELALQMLDDMQAMASASLPTGSGSDLPPNKWIHKGRLHYEEGCNQLYVDGEYFNLQEHQRARLCLLFLINQGAWNRDSARHLRDEIDVFVRSMGEYDAAAAIKIDDYFKDPTGRLFKLQKLLIRSSWGTGKYYIMADV